MTRPRFFILLVAIGLLSMVSACSQPPAATSQPPAISQESASPAPTVQAEEMPSPTVETKAPTAGAVSAPQARTLVSAQNDWFATAATCNACHQNLKDANGKDISQAENWRATMMANAARDPYYLASVSIEVAVSPAHSEAIQQKCATCHMPLAVFSDVHAGVLPVIFGENGYTSPQHPLYDLARDGVSCTACHQIPPNQTNAEIKQNGDLNIDFTKAAGERTIYGPYPVDDVSAMIMQGGSGFVPVESKHVRSSQLCATCHELYINYIAEDGTISDNLFPEQTPYAEWLHSEYAQQASCQSCHMDRVPGKTPISNLTADKKHPHFAIHNFHGSNIYMLSILQTFGDEIGVQATDENFTTLIERSANTLGQETARLSISPPIVQEDALTFDVTIETLTGHKFPTSFPSRRAWLHVTVKDSSGTIIFESGKVSSEGKIMGNDNDETPGTYEPHYDLITAPDQVQIYEDIMQTPSGQVTTLQMKASGYIKDNRLLPAGFDKSNANPYIAVLGKAAEDDDFIGGQDTVTYQIPAASASGPFTIEVELLYQSVSYRWAQDVLAYDTEQTQTFSRYYDAVENAPIIVASQSLQSQ